MFTFSAFTPIIRRQCLAVHVTLLPLIGLMLLSGCVTAEGQATLAPLRPAIPAEKSPEQLGTNNQDDVAAEPSAPDTVSDTEPSVPDTALAAETAGSDAAIPSEQDPGTATAGDTLAADEMTALPTGDETLIAAVIPPPAPEPEPELPPELDPESLIGSPASDVEQRLGLPVLRRLEGTTEVWQYRMESCIIDFVLPEGATVLAWNSRHRQHGQSYDALSCRRDLAVKAGL